MAAPNTLECPSCGATNLGSQTRCLMCEFPLVEGGEPAQVVEPAEVEEKETGGSLWGTLWRLALAGLILAGIVYVPGWVKGLVKKEPEDPRPSWERWNLKPRQAPEIPKKGGFHDTQAPAATGPPPEQGREDRLCRELMTRMGVEEQEARRMLREMGADGVQELIHALDRGGAVDVFIDRD